MWLALVHAVVIRIRGQGNVSRVVRRESRRYPTMKFRKFLAVPIATVAAVGLATALLTPASAQQAPTTYTANLAAVPLNGVTGSGTLSLTLNGKIWTLERVAGQWRSQPLLETRMGVSAFGEGALLAFAGAQPALATAVVDKQRTLSLIGEDGGRCVRMAHLATVGSHYVNGVAALHSELLKESVLRDFYELWPERFGNVTNGVTPRRFLALSNPGLRALLDETIGDGWLTDLEQLRRLENFVEDPAFRARWREVKRANKRRLAEFVHATTGIELDHTWMFDIQVKRIHEYKRQHLNVLHIITLYNRLKRNPSFAIAPRAFIFGGKAAPGYFMAKRIIKLITAIGATVNNDPLTNRYMKVVFLPNFNVKTAHLVYPAANLSEQISTAGKEASGTGNMKFMINGALTIGTLDGANVEIREEAGPENFFLFGLTEDQVETVKRDGYRPMAYIERDRELAAVLELIASGAFTHGDTEILKPVVDNLIHDDPFLVLADYRSYVDCQDHVSRVWNDRDKWSHMSILNSARSGKFSSDRAIAEYCDDIWKVPPMSVDL